MPKENKDIKNFNMRVPKELWIFLKRTSAIQEVSMAKIIIGCIEQYKKRLDKKVDIE